MPRPPARIHHHDGRYVNDLQDDQQVSLECCCLVVRDQIGEQ